MQTVFGTATGSVATWLADNYAENPGDPATVPDDVIEWTKNNLPSNPSFAVVSRPPASRTART